MVLSFMRRIGFHLKARLGLGFNFLGCNIGKEVFSKSSVGSREHIFAIWFNSKLLKQEMNSFSIFMMKFSMSGKGEKKHSHKEGMGSEVRKITSEREWDTKIIIHKGRLGLFF